jgi:hypothetical protein
VKEKSCGIVVEEDLYESIYIFYKKTLLLQIHHQPNIPTSFPSLPHTVARELGRITQELTISYIRSQFH